MNHSLPAPGSYAWRRDRGLLTLSDHIRAYAMKRRPRGPYFTPMRDDLLPGWRA